MWCEISHTITPDPSDSAFLKTLVQVHNTRNSVANLMAHLRGCYLVHQCHQQENSVKEIEIVREEVQENLCALEYSQYMSLITLCGCGECTDVAKFDADNRYENDCTTLSHDSRIIRTEVNVIKFRISKQRYTVY